MLLAFDRARNLVISGTGNIVIVTRRERASAVPVESTVALGSRLAAVLAITRLTAVITSTRRRAVIATAGRASVTVITGRASRVDAKLETTKLGALDLVKGTLVVVTVVVLDDTLVRTSGINIGERDGTVLATNILEVLPAGVGRKVGDDAAELATTEARLTARRRGDRGAVARRRFSSTTTAAVVRVRAVASRLRTTALALLGVLDYDALAHEVLTIKVLDGILSITMMLELDKAKCAHDADIVEAL